VGPRGQICKFCTPFHKFVTGEARNFKFGVHDIDLGTSHPKYDKIRQGCAVEFQRPNVLLCTPFHKFVTGVARNFKFGVQIGLDPLSQTTMPLKRHGLIGAMGRISNFWLPRSIYNF